MDGVLCAERVHVRSSAGTSAGAGPEMDTQDVQSGHLGYHGCGGGVMAMGKPPIEVEAAARATVGEVVGTKTKKDTVNGAVREVGQRMERLRALARLGEMADQGDFDEFAGNKAAYRR